MSPSVVDAMNYLKKAARIGVAVRVREGRLFISPAKLCPADLKQQLSAHKAAIVSLFEARAAGMSNDEAPWLYISKQVLAGEYDSNGFGSSVREAVIIGLQSIQHPLCQQAFKHLSNP